MKKKIKLNKLREMLQSDEDFLLINVLNRENFSEMHIPKSLHIPVHSDNFEEKFQDTIPNKNRKIIIYCWHSECPTAEEAIEKLEKLGYKNLLHYNGGIQEWYDKGYKVHKN